MPKILKNVISFAEIAELIRFFYIDDQHMTYHSWRDYRMKLVPYHHKDTPKHLHAIVDRLIDYPYTVNEEVVYQEGSDFTSKLHVDSGPNKDHYGHVLLIPLTAPGGDAGTVFFKNHLFDHLNINPTFTYGKGPHSAAAWSVEGVAVYIEDMHELIPYMNTSGEFTYNGITFVMDDKLRRKILAKTSQNKGSYYKNRTDDYPSLTLYDETLRIDDEFVQRFLAHHAPADLVGLTVDQFVPWTLGDVIVFERTVLHCGSSTADGKIGVTVIVDRK